MARDIKTRVGQSFFKKNARSSFTATPRYTVCFTRLRHWRSWILEILRPFSFLVLNCFFILTHLPCLSLYAYLYLFLPSISIRVAQLRLFYVNTFESLVFMFPISYARDRPAEISIFDLNDRFGA